MSRLKHPIWEKLLALETAYRKWAKEVLKIRTRRKYTPELLLLKRDRTRWIIRIKFGSFLRLEREWIEKAESYGLKVVTQTEEDGMFSTLQYLVIADLTVTGRVVLQELGGRVSLGRLRRLVQAFCNLSYSTKKKHRPQLEPPEVPEGWKQGHLCQTGDGLFIFVPYIDRYDEFEQLENEFWEKKEEDDSLVWPYPYRIVFSSPLHQMVEVYTHNAVPTRKVHTFPGLSRHISPETILALFKDPPYDMISRHLYPVLGVSGRVNAAEFLWDKDKTELALAVADEILRNQDRSVISAMYVKGLATVVLEWQDRLNELEEKVEQRKAESRLALKNPKMCPPLPHFRKDMTLLPHQAATLASLDKQQTALLGMDMGGGKTLVSLYDALLNVARGRAKRPCIVMPNNLLYQFKNEVAKFTAGSVNAIIVNTYTVKRFGTDKLRDMIVNAPPNTIVLCSYDWLALGSHVIPSGKYLVNVHDRAAWLMGECNVDMVTLDEAHFIKNETSRRSEATLLLTHAKVRRAMSGTIAPNKLDDLVVPTTFVKPHVFRGRDNFVKQYAVNGGRGGIRGYNPGAPDEIRRKLRDEGAIFLSRAAWIYLLPKRKIRVHRVTLPEHLRVEYQRILNDTMDELEQMALKNPEIRAALEGVEDLSKFPFILQKLTVLDRFLTAPDTVSELIKALPEDKRVSPKVSVIEEILDEHFARKDAGKVIILCRFKTSARHLLEQLKLGREAIYYDGDTKQNLVRFKNDPRIKVMVAVDASLKHGWNITEATRIIGAELNYTWGDEDQRFGRIFRIGQENNVVYDILLTDRTFEVTKFANVVTKHVVNAYVTSDWAEEFELKNQHLELIPLNKENIAQHSSFELAQEHSEVLSRMLEFERRIGEKKYARIFGRETIKPPRAKPISLEKIPVPPVKNVDPEIDWYINPRTGKPLPKPKFDFSLVQSKLDVAREDFDEPIGVDDAKAIDRAARWLKVRAITRSPRYGIEEGEIWYVKRRDENTFYGINAKKKTVVILSKHIRKRAFELVQAVPEDKQRKLDEFLARQLEGKDTGDDVASLNVSAVSVGVDDRGRLWLKVKGVPKNVRGVKRRRIKQGMRRLVRGRQKVAAVLALLDQHIGIKGDVRRLVNSVVRRFKVEAAPKRPAKVRDDAIQEVILFPRPNIDKDVWEIFIPEYRPDLVSQRFVADNNVTLLQLKTPAQAPKRWRKVALKLHRLLKEQERQG